MRPKTILIAAMLVAPLAARPQQATPAAPPAVPDLTAPVPAAVAPAVAQPLAVVPAPAAPAPAAEKKEHGFFPIWGDKVRAKGFDLPEPFGFSVNYYNQTSDIEIANLKLGFNGGPMYDASGLISVPAARTEASALNIRPNVMIFPFLTVYAVYSVGDTATNVNVRVGDGISFDTVAESGAQVVTVGGTLQGGYKGFFGVVDFNASVSDVDRLADTVGANLLSFRVGYNHKLNPRGRALAVWAGTAGQVLEVDTKGSVRMGDVIPPPSQDQIDAARARCAELDLAQRAACNAIVDQIEAYDGNTTVEYSLEKRPAGVWNMVLGAQYSLDRSWQFRFETTFLNGRTTYLAMTEYRFDIL